MAYRLLQHGGYPVIAELRLFPSETPKRGAGKWSGRIASVPTGGITARLLRSVPLGSDIATGLKAANRSCDSCQRLARYFSALAFGASNAPRARAKAGPTRYCSMQLASTSSAVAVAPWLISLRRGR